MSNKHELVEWGWAFKENGQRYYKNIFVQFAQLTPGELRGLYESQKRMCAVCSCVLAWPMEKKPIMGYPFEVDHEHFMGERRCSHKKYVRGLLCQLCNKGLNKIRAGGVVGELKKDPVRLAQMQDYLLNYKRKMELS